MAWHPRSHHRRPRDGTHARVTSEEVVIKRAVWSIVLAGGSGSRMQPTIRRWLGEDRPKQYCTFVGRRSMLRHTWDRALALAPAERVVTVVAREHRPFLEQEAAAGKTPGVILEQPRDRGTAVGTLFPLSYVLAKDPRAAVLILPADHFLRPQRAFLRVAASACLLAQKLQRLVLLGAIPDSPETDYGWILPLRPRDLGVSSGPLPIRAIEEKPDAARAGELLAAGALWSTMIVAAPVAVLWKLAEQMLPGPAALLRNLSPLSSRAREVFPSSAADLVALETTYRSLPRADFSRDLLQPAGNLSLALPLLDVEWSDWGRPERIAQALDRLGGGSIFRHESLSKPDANADSSLPRP